MIAGISPYSETLQSWLAAGSGAAPTIGGFLYLTVASLAAGMTVCAVHWAVLDSIHARTGLRPPPPDFAQLSRNVAASVFVVESRFRHYQYYMRMVVARGVAYAGHRVRLPGTFPLCWPDAAFALFGANLLDASPGTLRKYDERAGPQPRLGLQCKSIGRQV